MDPVLQLATGYSEHCENLDHPEEHAQPRKFKIGDEQNITKDHARVSGYHIQTLGEAPISFGVISETRNLPDVRLKFRGRTPGRDRKFRSHAENISRKLRQNDVTVGVD
ncbi:hypothetical protein HPB52_003967 [Rhipicephalus sanguineus]|uniref:Uncharacterized protein n=1 Tax=Rhipicephalus sanguineus TaxID=34632 RepID=A0A9D4PLM5_RHISA|nr:hypothetical protein HPB52_003967 [Rhipicephalus sanguineus]